MYSGVTRGAQVTGIAVMALSLTWISAVLRMYVRVGILKFVGREDWLMFAAMILLTILCSLFLAAIGWGLGAHMFNIPSKDKETGFKVVFICELLYVVTTAVTKLSIGVYFLRLSGRKYQRWVIYTTLAVVMVFSTMYFFFLLFQCTPINFLWTRFGKDSQGSCLHSPILANVTYAHAAMSAITDWAFGVLPIFFVWNMKMNPRTKLSVVLVLSLGFFASSATIVRIVYIRSLTETDDYSWEGINLVKWSMVEPAIAITASNIATLRPLFQNFFMFASKRFDSQIDDEERLSGDSRFPLRQGRNSIGPRLYSPEFAEMLGLSQMGVTTQITAGGSGSEKNQLRRKFSLARAMSYGDKGASQTELSPVPPLPKGDLDWGAGIQKTTVITVDT